MGDDLDTLVLKELRGLSADVAKLNAKLDGMNADPKSKIRSLRADVASEFKSLRAHISSDILRMQKDTHDQIVGLRHTLFEYHSTVVGRGMLIGEQEARMRRVEQRLNLPSTNSH
jgi:hypothetical protein